MHSVQKNRKADEERGRRSPRTNLMFMDVDSENREQNRMHDSLLHGNKIRNAVLPSDDAVKSIHAKYLFVNTLSWLHDDHKFAADGASFL